MCSHTELEALLVFVGEELQHILPHVAASKHVLLEVCRYLTLVSSHGERTLYSERDEGEAAPLLSAWWFSSSRGT